MTTEDIQQGASVTAMREELLRRRLSGRRNRQRPGIAPADRRAPLALSYGQQQMWFLNRLEPESAEYAVPLAFRLRGALDLDAVRSALSEVVARHEILRTRYRLGDSEPEQVVDAPAPVGVPLTDLTAVPEHDRENRCRAVLSEEARLPFDLEAQWPLRARLVALDAEDHVLAVVFHHIAFDAWSTRVFAREFDDLYSAFALGVPSTLPDLPVQYADFASWQRTEVPQREMNRHLEYWRAQLADLPVVDLPGDRIRPAVRSHAGAAVPFELSRSATEQVRALAAGHDATPFVVLLAAFQLLIGRYTGTADVPVGTVVSGRTLPDLQGLIGYGINNLVMRSRWDDRQTFAGLVSHVREVLITAYDHQAVPFARLADELQPERDMSRTPLYQVAITMHEPRNQAFTLPGLRAEQYPITGGVAKVDLELQVGEAGEDGLAGQLVYAEAVFDRSTAERMVRHYVRLLNRALAAPHLPVADLDLMDAAERSVVLGSEPAAVPVTRTLRELFEERVRVCPGAVAVVAGGVRLSYGEVNERANRVAWRLRELGVGAESLVGVCLPRGVDLVPVLLGVLKAGAGYVPLDPAHPVERLGFVVGDAGVSVVVSSAGVVLPGFVGVSVVVDFGSVEWGGLPVVDPPVVSGVDGVAYVIYTSGSTGRPKGVVVSQANVVRLLASAQEHFAFDDADVWSMTHSFAFDVSVFEMWGALAFGGVLVVVSREVSRSPEDLLGLLVAERVTVLSQTPSAFRALAPVAVEDPRPLALRAVVFAGERLEPAELRDWAQRHRLNRVALVNMYGITETTVHTTYHRLSRQDVESGAGNPIGRPLSDLRVHLLDAHGRLVPVGVVGEIYVGGPGLARGYLGRPGLTAERFVPDPFGSGQRLYRSGDLARRRADGSLDFVGRADDQVKIRGFRVELGEIEAVLAAVPVVREAVVLLRAGRLVAYLVVSAAVDVVGLREVLARGLPEYMVPAAFVVVDALPLTANGKLDKRALPEPGDDAYGRSAHVPATTPAEHVVAGVWQDVLGLDRVGVTDGFFDLGGDSIKAVAIAGRLRDAGHHVTARDVLAYRSVRELAAATSDGTAAFTAVAPLALIDPRDRELVPDGVTDAYPLTQSQLGMLVEMLATDGPASYHRVATARVGGDEPFSREALRRALDELTRRHDALRTSVDLTTYSVPMQVVHASAEIPLTVTDLSHATEEERDRVLRAAIQQESTTVLAHDRAPLLRVRVHLLPGAAWLITIAQSHLIIDGWTFSRLRADLLEVYRAVRDGRDLPGYRAPQVRFADTVAAELRALESGRERAYWRELINGRPRFVLPDGLGDRTAPPRAYRVVVDFEDLRGPLRDLAAAAGVPLKSVLLAAHVAVLRRYTAHRAFHTGLVVHCRPEAAGAETVYGSHLNTVPFPVGPPAATWAAEARAVFDRELDLWPHRDFPMPAMQLELADGGRLVHGFFSYEDFEGPRTPLAETADGGFSHSEFSFAVTAGDGHLVLETGTGHLRRDHGDRLAGMYRVVLENLAAGGSPRDAHLAAGEAQWLLDQAVVPAERVTRPATAVFEAHVERTPDAPAVITDDAVWTYAELDERANRIAHHLRSLGAGPESRVAVLLRRGPDLVAALLGAWKAGAAYVPLDPANPPQRLLTLLRVAAPVVVVTESALEHVVAADPELRRRSVLLDREAAALAAAPPDRPRRTDDLDTLAYVIFTSGSTGLPKGVQISHLALANYQRSAVAQYFGEHRGGTPLFCSVAFDVSATSLHLALAEGLPVHLAPQDLDLDRLGDWLLAHGPFTLIDITPSLLDVLAGRLTDEQFDGLTAKLALGGEAMRGATATRLHRALGDGRVVNSYGPTEVTVACVEHVLHDWTGAETVPIGRPFAATSAHVLDERLAQVPAGVPGELCLGGDSLARGYLDQPALTAERFVPDPYGEPGGRLYRSGDLARVLPDGTLDFLGRLDHQVKIRGNRVELGEIESVLGTHPAVADVRAALDGDRLVAYLVAAGVDRPSGLALRELLAARLPDYMVPAAYVWLPAIPLTTNGKLDTTRLPAAGGDAVAHRPYVPPASAAEESLARVFAAVLGLERAGRDDRFFELGGNSILVFKLISAAAEEGLRLSLVQVYADDRLQAIAASAAPPERPGEAARGARTGGVGADAPGATETVPGLSIAVLRDGDVVEVRGEGVLRAGGQDAVTADTIFQAGSLSKHVTAFALLRLTDRGVLDLDTEVSAYLRTWRRLDGSGVTLRHLLAHLSGLAPTPAPGYARDGELPTVLDLLTGRGALSTAAAEPEVPAGQLFRKANTHYWVIEQVLTDVTGRPFPDLLEELVFSPVGMRHSSVRQDFPERYAGPVAHGHDAAGRPLPDGWRRWPDLAAGGLWSTATDLARLTLEIRRGYLGRPLALLSQDSARRMLTVQHRYSGYGLGTVVDDGPAGLGFGHGGSADGYHAVTLCRVERGSGFVVLTNSDDGAAVAKGFLTRLDREPGA